MKTPSYSKSAKYVWGKLAVLVCGLGLLAGCVVTSVYPYYTVKDLTFDAGLAGRWAKPGTPGQYWDFAPVEGKAYAVTSADNSETNYFDGYLFQLKGTKFLDLCTTNRDEWRQLPLHLLVKVEHTDRDLKLAVLDYDWLGKLLEAHPKALRHIVVPETPHETNHGGMFYLTADTRDLQKFILQHRDNTNAFAQLDLMQRATP